MCGLVPFKKVEESRRAKLRYGKRGSDLRSLQVGPAALHNAVVQVGSNKFSLTIYLPTYILGDY